MNQQNFEQQVQLIASQTKQSPSIVRQVLMAQLGMTAEQYAQCNSQTIRGTIAGGRGFVGQPG